MSGMRGEVEVVLDGTTYRLVMDFNALAAFEEAAGLNVFDFFDGLVRDGGAPPARMMRMLLHATLSRHHPDASMELAGDILSEDPGVFTRLVAVAFPQAEAPTSGNAKGGRGK